MALSIWDIGCCCAPACPNTDYADDFSSGVIDTGWYDEASEWDDPSPVKPPAGWSINSGRLELDRVSTGTGFRSVGQRCRELPDMTGKQLVAEASLYTQSGATQLSLFINIILMDSTSTIRGTANLSATHLTTGNLIGWSITGKPGSPLNQGNVTTTTVASGDTIRTEMEFLGVNGSNEEEWEVRFYHNTVFLGSTTTCLIAAGITIVRAELELGTLQVDTAADDVSYLVETA